MAALILQPEDLVVCRQSGSAEILESAGLGRSFTLGDESSEYSGLAVSIKHGLAVLLGRSPADPERNGPYKIEIWRGPDKSAEWELREPPLGCVFSPPNRVGSDRFCLHFESGRIEIHSLEAFLKGGEAPLSDPIRLIEEHSDAVDACRFSPDGQWLVSASRDTTVGVWALGGGANHRLKGHGDWVSGVEFWTTGRLVSWSLDRTIRDWDFVAGRQVQASKQQDATLTAVAIPRYPHWIALATGDRQGRIKLWGPELQETLVLEAESGVTALQFVGQPDSPVRLASASEDGAVRSWDLESGECISSFLALSAVRRLAVRGSQIAAADFHGNIYLLETESRS